MNKMILTAVIFLSANVSAQITNLDLVQMKKAGISEEIIKTKIATEESRFDVSTDAIVIMKSLNFSDDVISLMIQKNEALKSYSERHGTDITNQEINAIYSVKDLGNKLIINDSFELIKGNDVQIYLPANGKDFMFIAQNTGFSTKLLGKVADAVGTGASAIGIGSGNIKVIQGANKVLNNANAVKYGVDALEKIQDLPISNKAKKIAGKKIKITNWEIDNGGYILKGELDKKKYLINLQEAVATGEIKLK